jgi:hypothetical protein
MIEKCPGFRNRKETPADKMGAAEKGTRIHKALEKDSIEDLPDEEERHLAQTFKDFVDSLIASHLPALPKPDRRELRLNIDLGGGLFTYGTCDRLLVYGDKAKQVDYKSGYREVEDPEFNPQAWAYVIGTFQKYDFLNEIEFFIPVPNRDEILFHTYKRSDVPDMQLRLNTIIRRAMEFDWITPDVSILNPQPSLCEYCQFQASCPALAAKALAIGNKLLPGLPVPSSIKVASGRPEDVAHLLRLVPLMEGWAKQVRADALRLNMEEGVEIPGFKRVERSTPRSVTSVLGAWDAVKGEISIEDFLAICSKVSVPQLEDYFAEKAKRGDKGKARQSLENKLRAADVLNDEGSVFYLKEQKR